MRFQSHHLRFNQNGPGALPHPLDQIRHHLVHGFIPRAVHVTARHAKRGRHTMDFRARLGMLRNTDRVTVVLDEEQYGQFFARGPIHGFEKLAFTGCALSG